MAQFNASQQRGVQMSPMAYSRMSAGSRQKFSYADFSAQRKSRQQDRYADPNSVLMGDQSPAKSAKFNIQKDREYDRIKARLQEEFNVIDKNNDGRITLDEILDFLKEKSGGKEVEQEPIEVIFNAFDSDGNGRIELNEFVDGYFYKQVEDEMRLKELEEMVVEDTAKMEEINTKLEEVRANEVLNAYRIMENSPLSISIIEARDLPRGTVNPYVVISVGESQQQKSDFAEGTTDPIFNEVMNFDITTGKEEVNVQVISQDIQEKEVGRCSLSLEDYNDQYRHENEWRNLDQGGRIKFQVHWIYSKVQFLESILEFQKRAIQEEKDEIKELEKALENMKVPFGFVEQLSKQVFISHGLTEEQAEQMEELKKRAGLAEKEVAKRMEVAANRFANKTLGVQEIPWYVITVYCAYLNVCLTCMSMFIRADFVSLTICCVAIQMVLQPERAERNYFRYLVLGLVISLFYDVFWLFIKSGEYHTELNVEDGGTETKVRRFSLYISYFNFFFRIFMTLVFWKDSLDFEIISSNARRSSQRNRHDNREPEY